MKSIAKIHLLLLFAFCFSQISVAQTITSSRGNSFCEGNTTTLTFSGPGSSGNNFIWRAIDMSNPTKIDTLPGNGASVVVTPYNFGTMSYRVYNAGSTSTLAATTITVKDCCGAGAGFAFSKVCTPMIIDGNDDELEWGVSDWTPISRLAAGSGTSTPAAGKWKILYDNDNLYLYVVISSNTQPINAYWNGSNGGVQNGWQGDGVEFFMDAPCSGNAPLQIGFMYPGTGTTPGTYNNTNCTNVSFVGYTAIIKPWNSTTREWALEVKFPAALNNVNLNGDAIKIEVGINRSNSTGTVRTAQYHTWTNSALVFSDRNLLSSVPLADCASTRTSKDEICKDEEIQLSSSIRSATLGSTYNWQTCYGNCDDNSVGNTTDWENVLVNTTGYVSLTPDFKSGNEVYYRAVYNNEVAACPIKISLGGDIPISRSATICEGKSYDFYGQELSTADVYTKTVVSSTTCDSVITLTLSVLPNKTDSRTKTICLGETYDFYGQILSTAGVYTATVSTPACDSVITLTLDVKNVLTDSRTKSICLGKTYDFYGQELSTANTYTAYVPSTTGGCDSIITLTLEVKNILTDSRTKSICSNASYNFYGEELSTANTYTAYVSSTTGGCDSIITLYLEVYSPGDASISPISHPAFSCEGRPLVLSTPQVVSPAQISDQYWLLDDVKFASGAAASMDEHNGKILKYFVETDCYNLVSNSIVVNVGQKFDTLITDLHYYGEPYVKNGFVISSPEVDTNEYTQNLTSFTGCDSIVTLRLTVEYQSNPYVHCPEILPDRSFSPNGDGFNDVWLIRNIECYDYWIKIFDRYGKLIHRWDNDFKGWNGAYSNGKPAPSTDYWYVIYLRDTRQKEFTGHFNLKR